MDGDGDTTSVVEQINPSQIIEDVTGYAVAALLAGIGIGTALLAWKFVKRFLRA
tara:strand:+ start:295 stop:456 length:162 start_codon:yes stop_codon:yes gene_type:complete